MHHKSLILRVQCSWRKFHLVDDFHPPGGGQSLDSIVAPPFKLTFCKTEVRPAEGEKRPPQNNLHASVGQQKSFLEEPSPSQLVLKRKSSYDYTKRLQGWSVDLFSFDVGFSNLET